jgi:hypothetical protein
MSEVRRLLEKSGYSSKAIEYYLNKVNVGFVENQASRQPILDRAVTQ